MPLTLPEWVKAYTDDAPGEGRRFRVTIGGSPVDQSIYTVSDPVFGRRIKVDVEGLTQDILDALAAANNPSAANPFATMADVGGSYVFSTGLTDTAGTITANISTGVAGGQTAIGGTGAGEILTLSSTSNGTKGSVRIGNINLYEVNSYVGIGTGATNPVTPLQSVETATTAVRGGLFGQYSGSTDGSRIILRKARGTFGTPTVITSGDTLSAVVGEGYDGTNFLQMAAIRFDSTGTIAANRVPTKIIFQTGTNAATSVLTNAGAFSESQFFGVRTISPIVPLHVVAPATTGEIAYILNSAGNLGAIFGVSGTTAYLTSAASNNSFAIGINGGTDSIFVANAKNVGIRQTTPLATLHVLEPTTMDMFYLETETTGANPLLKWRAQRRTTTTDATLTTIDTISTTTDSNISVVGIVQARRTGGAAGANGDGASYELKANFKNVGGTVTLIGGGVSAIGESQGGWDCQLNPSGASILVQVLGAADNNITWHSVEVKVSEVTS